MPQLNKVLIMGHLGRDVELKPYGNEGKQMARFSVALQESKDKDVSWVNVVAFDKMAEFCSGMKKGDLALVEGKIKISNYTNKQGEKKQSFDVIADSWGGVKNLSYKKQAKNEPPVDEEMPF